MKNKSMVSLVMAAAVLILFVSVGSINAAKPYPSKSIQCLIGYPPGGSIDAFTRIVSKYAPKYLKTEMKVINKPGGGGEIALNTLSTSKPDGYTIGHAVIINTILKPSIRPEGQFGYKTEDLTHITVLSKVPATLYVRPESPYNSLTELVEAAKKNPGKITVGTSGAYTLTDASRLLVENSAGIKLKRVVFQGGGEMRKAIAGAHVDVMSSNAFFTVKAKDTLKPLGVADSAPYALAPQVPTYESQGYPIIDFVTRGFAVPKDVPQDVIEYLEEGFRQMAKDPEFVEDVKKIGNIIEFHDHNQASAMIDELTKQYAEVIAVFKEELANKMKQ